LQTWSKCWDGSIEFRHCERSEAIQAEKPLCFADAHAANFHNPWNAKPHHERSHPKHDHPLDPHHLQHSDHRLYLQSIRTPSGLCAADAVYLFSRDAAFEIMDVEGLSGSAAFCEKSGLTCSPDEAQRNPGQRFDRSQATLRSTTATC
jgi:hypothetical protein